jgi:hypothetical protein
VVLGIQWLATLNTVQVNWSQMFLKFTIECRDYKLQGAPPRPPNSATAHHLALEPFEKGSHDRLGDKPFHRVGCNDTNLLTGSVDSENGWQTQIQFGGKKESSGGVG